MATLHLLKGSFTGFVLAESGGHHLGLVLYSLPVRQTAGQAPQVDKYRSHLKLSAVIRLSSTVKVFGFKFHVFRVNQEKTFHMEEQMLSFSSNNGTNM